MAKTGERKAQILQTLAAMLEDPKGERITTALLAARLDVSEAALYRHFASKAQMFEGLIEFIEQTLFTLVNKIQAEEKDAMKQIEATVATLLGFAQKNPGMTRVLIGDALVNEDERLQARVNQLLDRLEASLRQSARLAVERLAAAGRLGRERLRERAHRLRDRPLAPVRQERLQARAHGGLGAAVAHLRALRSGGAGALPELQTARLALAPRPALHGGFDGALLRRQLGGPPRPLVAARGAGILQRGVLARAPRALALGVGSRHRCALRAAAARRPRRAPVLGTCNYTNIVRGPFQACHLGYQIARDQRGPGLDARGARSPERLRLRGDGPASHHGQLSCRGTSAAAACSSAWDSSARASRGTTSSSTGAWRDHVLTALTNPRFDDATLQPPR